MEPCSPHKLLEGPCCVLFSCFLGTFSTGVRLPKREAFVTVFFFRLLIALGLLAISPRIGHIIPLVLPSFFLIPMYAWMETDKSCTWYGSGAEGYQLRRCSPVSLHHPPPWQYPKNATGSHCMGYFVSS